MPFLGPLQAMFGPSKVTKCLENGLFFVPKIVKKWIKNVFLQTYVLGYWGCTNKWNEPMLSPC